MKKSNGNKVDIYESYKSNLKAFSKQSFDPFRRKNGIILVYTTTEPLQVSIVYNLKDIKKNQSNIKYIQTTIGQLNFFKWIIENNIYQYICKYRDIIEDDMNNSISGKNEDENSKKEYIVKTVKDKDGNDKIIKRKKRKELSKSTANKIQLIKNKKKDKTLRF